MSTYSMKEIKDSVEGVYAYLKMEKKPVELKYVYEHIKHHLVQNRRTAIMVAKRAPLSKKHVEDIKKRLSLELTMMEAIT